MIIDLFVPMQLRTQIRSLMPAAIMNLFINSTLSILVRLFALIWSYIIIIIPRGIPQEAATSLEPTIHITSETALCLDSSSHIPQGTATPIEAICNSPKISSHIYRTDIAYSKRDRHIHEKGIQYSLSSSRDHRTDCPYPEAPSCHLKRDMSLINDTCHNQ